MMSTLLHSWSRPDPTRARELVLARPRDVGREARTRREMDALGIQRVGGSSLQTWSETLVTSQTDGPTLTAAAAADALPSAAVFTLPANFFSAPGKALRVTARGRITTAATPGTGQMIMKLGAVGGVTIFDTTALTMTASMTNVTWGLEATIICRTVGSGTTATSIGIGWLHNWTATNAMVAVPATAPAVSAGWDSTTSQQIRLTYTPSLATASYVCHAYVLEALN